MSAPFGQAITLRRRTKSGTDSFGNDVFAASDSVVTGVFNPGSSIESTQGQDTLTVQPTVYLPASANVTAIDALVINGDLYEVDGSPNQWASPLTGWSAGIEIKLRRVTG